jgi:hypothetical protein
MATNKVNCWQANDVKLVERVLDGRDLKEGELVYWKDSVCEFMGSHKEGREVILKMKGGDLVRISLDEDEIGRCDETKKRLPDWLRRGVVIYDRRERKEYVIEKVGNCRVYLYHAGDSQLASIMLYCCEAGRQPTTADWLKAGASCKHEGRKATILSVDGYMAKVRIDYGCDTICDLDICCGELRPDYDERDYGMTCEEISRRKDDIYFRVYRGGVRIGKLDKFTRQENKELHELDCREMINSCLIYGMLYDFYNQDTKKFVKYGKDFEDLLGYDLTLRLLRAQQERFKTAKVVANVYTDSEDTPYNSCIW